MNHNQFNETLKKLESLRVTKEVLQLVLTDHTNAEIAKLREKSEGTIRKQVSNLYKKFGIESHFPGHTSSQRDELKALFKQYKPEWVSDLQSAGENEVLVAQTAEQEEAFAKLHQESGAGIIARHSNLEGEEISSPIYVLGENKSIIYNNSTEIKEQRDEVIAYNYNWLVNYLKSVIAPQSGYLSSESLLDSLDALSQNILSDNQDLVIIYLKEIQKWSTPGNQVVLDDFLKELNSSNSDQRIIEPNSKLESLVKELKEELAQVHKIVLSANRSWLKISLRTVAQNSGYGSSELLLDALEFLSKNILYENRDLVIIYLKEIQKWNTPDNQFILDPFLKKLNSPNLNQRIIEPDSKPESLVKELKRELAEVHKIVINANRAWLKNFLRNVARNSGCPSSELLVNSLNIIFQKILSENQDLVTTELKEIQKCSTFENQVILANFLEKLNK